MVDIQVANAERDSELKTKAIWRKMTQRSVKMRLKNSLEDWALNMSTQI